MILPTVVMGDAEDKSQEGYCEGASIPIPDTENQDFKGKRKVDYTQETWLDFTSSSVPVIVILHHVKSGILEG